MFSWCEWGIRMLVAVDNLIKFSLCYFFIIIIQSFKFDGHIKPLLNGKMKQYGLFALCTPVNPANPFTSTPKELLQMYSCKMGLDLRIRKLDNR